MNPDELLAGLVEVLHRIRALLPEVKAAWDEDEVLRLAVERLWITAGNVAEEYRLGIGSEKGAEPWAELTNFRNRLAHALPGQIVPDRVWDESHIDLNRLLSEVEAHR